MWNICKVATTENWRLRIREILSPEERSAEWRWEMRENPAQFEKNPKTEDLLQQCHKARDQHWKKP